MRHRGRTVGLHEDACLLRTRDAFVETLGTVAAERRQREIEALPRVLWKGRTLYMIRCEAGFGNGPHDLNVPESLLWSLLSVDHFRCAYHR